MEKHVSYSVIKTDVIKISDYENTELLKINGGLELTKAPDGTENVLRFEGDKESKAVKLPKAIDLYSYYGVRFRVYSEKATYTTACLQFTSPTDTPPHMSLAFEVNFTGWKEFFVLARDLSVKFPFPLIDGYCINFSGTSMIGNLTGAIPDNVLYLDFVNAETAIFEITPPDNATLDTPDIYRSITDKYRAMMLGDEGVWDTPAYKKSLKASDDKCEEMWTLFKQTWQGGEKGKLYGLDIQRRPWKDEQDTMTLIARLFNLTQGYAKRGRFYHNSELLADIKAGLEYAYKYYYGKNIMTEGIFGNWWQWNVGIPLNLMPMLTLLEDELGKELLKKYLEPFDCITPFPMGSGANQMWTGRACIISGALTHNAHRICSAKHYMMDIFEYAEQKANEGDGGFYTDGSFIQHHQHPYTTGYGMGALDELTVTLYLTSGGPFEFTEEIVKNHYNWAFDTFRPIIYGKNATSTTSGRNVSRGISEIGNTKGIFRSLVRMCSYAPKDVSEKLRPFLKSIMTSFGYDMSDTVSLPNVALCKQIYNDDSIKAEKECYTKIFPNMRRVMYHGESFGAALALSSTHIAKYESINNENKCGWHYGDGMLTVFTDGYDFGKDFYLYANPYLVPATTANSAPLNPVCISMMLNGSEFAGGIEAGKFGAAAYQHCIRELDRKKRIFLSENDAYLTANKSYFFFDTEIVCLGSAIKDVSGTKVLTAVDNRLWRDCDTFSIDGEVVTPNGEMTEMKAKSAHFTNMGGYVFLDDHEVKYRKASRCGMKQGDELVFAHATGNATFLELVIDHGIGDEALNGKYAYLYLPTATAKETAEYALAPKIKVIKHTDTVHAVAKPSLDTAFAVFFEAGSFKYGDTEISADAPCIVSICGDTLLAADPTQTLEKFTVTVNQNNYTLDAAALSGRTASLRLKDKE